MRQRRWITWAWRGGAALVAVALVGYAGVCVVAADRFTQPRRIPIVGSPADLGLAYESVEFPSEDGITLRGWWMPATGSDKAIVIVHGRNSSRAADDGSLTRQARGLVQAGYNVLTFDLRAHGESDGTRYSFGPLETRDVRGAITYARSRGIPSGRVGLLGHSMGAATALLTAPETPDVAATVSDSAYARFTDLLDVQFPKQAGLPSFFLPGTELMAKLLYGVDVSQAAPIEVVGQIHRPIFFIHGASDTYVPPDETLRLWRASGEGPDLLWMVPGVEHDQAFQTNPEEYLRRVIDFFNATVR